MLTNAEIIAYMLASATCVRAVTGLVHAFKKNQRSHHIIHMW